MPKLSTLITAFLLLLALTGCFARRLELEDPMGLPLADPQLGVEVMSQPAPELALKLQNDLIRLLPRERQVRAQASPGDWTLSATLGRRRELTETAMPLFSGIAPVRRVHLELSLAASLKGPAGSPADSSRQWRLIQRGDALPSAEAELTEALLARLRDQLLRELQPKYSYR